MAEDWFGGFSLDRVDVGGVVLRVRSGGAGPPALLLHGHPRTHATWHRVAPLLAREHTVVCPDLRGWKHPPNWPRHSPASCEPEQAAVARHPGGARYAVRKPAAWVFPPWP